MLAPLALPQEQGRTHPLARQLSVRACKNSSVQAQYLCLKVVGVQVRFCSSGTEACISALRLMRAYTKRDKLIKFVGCFHGHGDAFLVQAGSGVATLGLPDSPGVPDGSTAGTLCATYNDLDSVKKVRALDSWVLLLCSGSSIRKCDLYQPTRLASGGHALAGSS